MYTLTRKELSNFSPVSSVGADLVMIALNF